MLKTLHQFTAAYKAARDKKTQCVAAVPGLLWGDGALGLTALSAGLPGRTRRRRGGSK